MLIVAAVRNTIKKCLQESRGWGGGGGGGEGEAPRLLGRRSVSGGLRAPRLNGASRGGRVSQLF